MDFGDVIELPHVAGVTPRRFPNCDRKSVEGLELRSYKSRFEEAGNKDRKASREVDGLA
jgi:hypothetical protein